MTTGDDGDDADTMAAEFALGTLDRAELREAEARIERDAAFGAEVWWWQHRLAPLAGLVRPAPPPPSLWPRIALAAGIDRGVSRSRGGFWKGTTAVSLALAAGLALFAFLPHPPAPNPDTERFAAAIGPLTSPAQFVAEARADGTLSVTAVSGQAAPAGRSYQLWSLPAGATAPVSLGVLPEGTRIVTPTHRASAGEQLLVSEEPAGGTTSAGPTGPVLFGGRLVAVSPAATPGR